MTSNSDFNLNPMYLHKPAQCVTYMFSCINFSSMVKQIPTIFSAKSRCALGPIQYTTGIYFVGIFFLQAEGACDTDTLYRKSKRTTLCTSDFKNLLSNLCYYRNITITAMQMLYFFTHRITIFRQVNVISVGEEHVFRS